jgi:hypothetical protein
MERAASEPSTKRRTTSIEPRPSRASPPPLSEILGRPLRIAVDPHTNADDTWVGVFAAMTGAF